MVVALALEIIIIVSLGALPGLGLSTVALGINTIVSLGLGALTGLGGVSISVVALGAVVGSYPVSTNERRKQR